MSQVFRQMVVIGVQALPMASLTSFSIGLTLAMQSASELKKLGGLSYVPGLVSVSLLRELGPLLVGVIVIGRSGSAVTAELGTMKVSEEIEALEVMAINPIRFLVVPRFLAMLVMLPVLTIFGDCVGMVGGWSICKLALDFPTAAYILRSLEYSDAFDLYSGLIKSVVFAWLIITVACHMGLAVEGGAEGVGQATTSSVVWSILLMLIANAVLTALFFFRMSDDTSKAPVLEVTDLVREFSGRRVLDGISFKVFKGETLIVMGASGCGKSTLLRHIIGSMQPTSGSVKLFGEEITTMNEQNWRACAGASACSFKAAHCCNR